MPDIPEPRATHEHVPPCYRHSSWHVNCPDCCKWHREHLRAEREEAAEREKARG